MYYRIDRMTLLALQCGIQSLLPGSLILFLFSPQQMWGYEKAGGYGLMPQLNACESQELVPSPLCPVHQSQPQYSQAPDEQLR